MSRRVLLPQILKDWMESRHPEYLPPGVQFRTCSRIPFWWLAGGRHFAGLTLWNRVYVVDRFWCGEKPDRPAVELVLHELVHVQQYFRNPILFPLRYLAGHLRFGYDANPAEVEARTTASRLAAEFFSDSSG